MKVTKPIEILKKEAEIKRVPAGLAKALNKFFNNRGWLLEGCFLRKDWDCGAKFALVIEESSLYEFLNYGHVNGWEVHTAWYEAFKDTGWYTEMQNSCVISFYEV